MDSHLAVQLARQSLWLHDSWLWLIRKNVLDGSRPNALDVGCGAGHVMEILSEHMDVVGVDSDPDMVALCKSKDLGVQLAEATELPFEDDTFDVVYCSFLMLWLPEPERAIHEMFRVSKKWVICLAEPDYGGRIDHPPSLEALGDAMVSDLRSRGADPFVGRKLRAIFSAAGLDPEIGVHQGVWPLTRLKAEMGGELGWADESSRPELRAALLAAIDEGTAFQFNPVFYALAKK
jgi:SAM-dependent methyltransferase